MLKKMGFFLYDLDISKLGSFQKVGNIDFFPFFLYKKNPPQPKTAVFPNI